jgi:amino acid adenylation domain-containing protein
VFSAAKYNCDAIKRPGDIVMETILSSNGFVSVVELLAQSFVRFSNEPALEKGKVTLTYSQLESLVGEVAAQLNLRRDVSDKRRCLIIADKSIGSYINMLGAIIAGWSYVPISLPVPLYRLEKIIAQTGSKLLMISGDAEPLPTDVVKVYEKANVVTLKTEERTERGSNVLGGTASNAPEDEVYVLFTSGSTGEPKGVPISHSNLMAYLKHSLHYYALEPGHRHSQIFSQVFDLSVHDLLVTLCSGATLCIPEPAEQMFPHKYIQKRNLTHWFSTPSSILTMKKLKLLGPACFPNLQQSIFCGEPLTYAQVILWREAAPNSVIENLYGPTEATIAFTRYSVDDDIDTLKGRESHTVVSIGKPMPGCKVAVENAGILQSEGEGELLLSGEQVCAGYLGDPATSEDKFISRDQTIWYKTGDRVKLSRDGAMAFRGRVDSQVKIRGHRVELAEIESVVRKVTGGQWAAAFLESKRDTGNQKIILCLDAAVKITESELICELAQYMPSYMVPEVVIFLSNVPLNLNGKIDRKAMLEQVRKNPSVGGENGI